MTEVWAVLGCGALSRRKVGLEGEAAHRRVFPATPTPTCGAGVEGAKALGSRHCFLMRN